MKPRIKSLKGKCIARQITCTFPKIKQPRRRHQQSHSTSLSLGRGSGSRSSLEDPTTSSSRPSTASGAESSGGLPSATGSASSIVDPLFAYNVYSSHPQSAGAGVMGGGADPGLYQFHYSTSSGPYGTPYAANYSPHSVPPLSLSPSTADSSPATFNRPGTQGSYTSSDVPSSAAHQQQQWASRPPRPHSVASSYRNFHLPSASAHTAYDPSSFHLPPAADLTPMPVSTSYPTSTSYLTSSNQALNLDFDTNVGLANEIAGKEFFTSGGAGHGYPQGQSQGHGDGRFEDPRASAALDLQDQYYGVSSRYLPHSSELTNGNGYHAHHQNHIAQQYSGIGGNQNPPKRSSMPPIRTSLPSSSVGYPATSMPYFPSNAPPYFPSPSPQPNSPAPPSSISTSSTSSPFTSNAATSYKPRPTNKRLLSQTLGPERSSKRVFYSGDENALDSAVDDDGDDEGDGNAGYQVLEVKGGFGWNGGRSRSMSSPTSAEGKKGWGV
jgi:hypothetical protein